VGCKPRRFPPKQRGELSPRVHVTNPSLDETKGHMVGKGQAQAQKGGYTGYLVQHVRVLPVSSGLLAGGKR
jgi:hypothetical protein